MKPDHVTNIQLLSDLTQETRERTGGLEKQIHSGSRKWKSLAVVSFISLCTSLPQAEGQDSLTTGLVAHYQFDGNTNDVSGNANHCIAYAAAYGTDRFGRSQACLIPANATNQLAIGTNGTYATYLGPEPRSFSCWLFLAQFNRNSGNWAKPNANGAQIPLSITGGVGIYEDSDLTWDTGNGVGIFHSAKAVSLNNWHHVCFVYNGSITTSKVYFDGSPCVTPTSVISGSKNILDGAPPLLHVSGEANSGNMYDDIRIYNRALSPDAVAQLYALESFCSPHPSRASATVTGGYVTGATLLDNGCGYSSAPSVRIVGGGGSGATAITVISGGIVTNVIITTAGSGYTSAPRILVESPPFVPTVSIAVSRVNVTQKVRINHNYILETSPDLLSWIPVGPQFTAEEELIVNEFDVSAGQKYFRLREVP